MDTPSERDTSTLCAKHRRGKKVESQQNADEQKKAARSRALGPSYVERRDIEPLVQPKGASKLPLLSGGYVLVRIPGHNDTTLMTIDDEWNPNTDGGNVTPTYRYLSGMPLLLQYSQKMKMQVVYRPRKTPHDPLSLNLSSETYYTGNTWERSEIQQPREQTQSIKEAIQRSFQRWLGELLLATSEDFTSENFVNNSMEVLAGCWSDLINDISRETYSFPGNLGLFLRETIAQRLEGKFQKVFMAHHHTVISYAHLTLPMKKFIEGRMAPEYTGKVEFRVQWDAIEFLKRNFEPGQARDLGSIRAVIGCPEYAELVTCAGYMERQWGKTGRLRLEFLGEEIPNYLDLRPQDRSRYEKAEEGTTHGSIYLHFRRKDEVYFRYEGSAADALEFGEQLLWLTSVLRRSNNDGLAQSTAYFTCCLDGDQHVMIGLNELCKPSNYAVDGHKKDCWTSMWNGGIIAPGFPIQNRILESHHIPRGLEVDATTMFQLAGTSTPIEFQDGIVVMGANSMLYPTWKGANCIQWHLVQSSNSEECVKYLRNKKWHKTKDLAEYLTQRAVLGCWETAWVILGTSAHEKYEAARSKLPNRKGKFGLVPEISFSSTVSAKPAGVGFSFTAGGKLSHTSSDMTVGIENAKLGFTASLQRMKLKPLLVYDVGEKQGLLVSELSMLLHLAQVYVSTTYGKDHVPFAEPHADGGQAAYDTIKTHGNDRVSLDPMDENDASKFSDHVKSFMQVFEAVSKSFEMARIASSTPFGRSRQPEGFDYTDILQRRYLHCMKEFPEKKLTPVWWKVAQHPGTIVIFGKRFGQLIGPNLDGREIFSHWTKIPSGDNLLTASMPCLQEIINSNETDKEDETLVFLAERLYWHRPHSTNLRRVCTHATREPCRLVQQVKKIGRLQPQKGYPVTVSDLKDMSNGAVVFGKLSMENIPIDHCHPIHPKTANQQVLGEDDASLPDRTKRTMRR